MQLTELALLRFRNLKDQVVTFNSPVTIVIGRNGQGKTSLLEAAHLLSQAKSFRTLKPADFIRWSKTPFSKDALTQDLHCEVCGLIETVNGRKKISFRITDGRKRVYINDNIVSQASDFYGQCVSVTFTPDNLELVKGAPSTRRRFLDQILSMVDQNYVISLVQYQRALKNRNALLATQRRNRDDIAGREQSLDALRKSVKPWDTLLIENGINVAKRRIRFIKEIESDFQSLYTEFSRSKQEKAHLEYISDYCSGERIIAHSELAEKFDHGLAKDLQQQRTLIGPHRDDLKIDLEWGSAKKSAREFSSQGQARSVVLSLKIAATKFLNAVLDESPILLLDDVESELDLERRASLLRIIESLNCQVILTATDLSEDLGEHLPGAQILRISEGLIEHERPGSISGVNS